MTGLSATRTHIVRKIACEPTANGGLVTEASMAGIAPGGSWPTQIAVVEPESDTDTYGILYHYKAWDCNPSTGDVLGAFYESRGGHKLLVIND